MSGWAGTPPGPGPHGADHRDGPEEVVGQAVDRPPQLLLDAVHDGRGVGGDGAGVVGDEQSAAVVGDLLQPLPLDPEPVAVHRVVEAADDGAHVLGAAPFVDVRSPGRIGSAVVRLGPGYGQDGHGCGIASGRGRCRSRSSGPSARRAGQWVLAPGRRPARRARRPRCRPGGISTDPRSPRRVYRCRRHLPCGLASRSRRSVGTSRRPASGPSAASTSAVRVVRVTGRGSSSTRRTPATVAASAGSTRGRRTITDRLSVRTGRGVPAVEAARTDADPLGQRPRIGGAGGVGHHDARDRRRGQQTEPRRVDVGEHGDRVVERMDACSRGHGSTGRAPR